MKFTKLLTNLGLLSLILTFFACQSAQKEEEQAEESTNEIQFTSSSDEALSSFMTGLALFDMGGGGQEARGYFNEAIEKDNSFMAGYLYRAMTSGSAEEFAADLDKAGSLLEGASDGEKMVYELVNTFRSNDWDKRMELANNFAQNFPEVPRAEFWVALTYQQNQQHNEARAHFQKAIDLNPEWIGGYSGLGNSYLFSDPKDFTKAESNAKKMVEIQPDKAGTHIFLGDCYRAMNDLEKARDAYAKAIEVQSDHPVAYLKKGHANSFLGNLDEARSDYQAGRQYDEYKGTSLVFEAFTYLYEDDYKSALEWLNAQAGSLEELGVPESRMNASKMTCINSCAWIALHHGENDHIKELLTKANPISEEIGQSVGTEEAVAQNAANMLFWASLSAAMDGDYETAIAKAEECKSKLEIVNNPRKLENYHFAHGYINMMQENYAEAVTHFEQSNMNNQYMKYNLAMALEKSGNSERAMEILNEIKDYNFNGIDYALIRSDVKRKLEISS